MSSHSRNPSEAGGGGGGPFSQQSDSRSYQSPHQHQQQHQQRQKHRYHKQSSHSGDSDRHQHHRRAKRHFGPPPFQPGFGVCPPVGPVNGACPPGPIGGPCAPPIPCPPPVQAPCGPGPIGAVAGACPPAVGGACAPQPCPPNVHPMQRGEINLCAELCAFVSVGPAEFIPPPPPVFLDNSEVAVCPSFPQGHGTAGFSVAINYALQTARIEFNVYTTKLSSCVIGIDIVQGSGCKGVLGQPLFDLGRIYRRSRACANLNGAVQGSFDVSLAELKYMLMGQWFLRVRSEQFPLGELGGYIRPVA